MSNINHFTLTEDTYIISDLHLGHDKVVDFEPKRLEAMKASGYTDHNKFIIDMFNSVVNSDDTVMLLGDIAFKSIPEYLTALNGNKLLILGNHDRPYTYTPYKELCTIISGVNHLHNDGRMWTYAHDKDTKLSALILDALGHRVLFSHYPIHVDDPWEYRKDGFVGIREKWLTEIYDDLGCTLNIHGHVHSRTTDRLSNINVSAEVLDFKPVKVSELIKNLN